MPRQAKSVIQPQDDQPLLPITAPRRQRDRVGKRNISGQVDAEVARALKFLAARQDTTIISLLGEAIDDLLRKYGQSIETR